MSIWSNISIEFNKFGRFIIDSLPHLDQTLTIYVVARCQRVLNNFKWQNIYLWWQGIRVYGHWLQWHTILSSGFSTRTLEAICCVTHNENGRGLTIWRKCHRQSTHVYEPKKGILSHFKGKTMFKSFNLPINWISLIVFVSTNYSCISPFFRCNSVKLYEQ